MLSDKLYHWFYGYAAIEISGRNLERFLNLVIQENFLLEEIVWHSDHLLSAIINRRDLPYLKEIADQIGCKVKTRSRIGLPFLLSWLKKRWSFLLGACVFSFGLFFMSSLVFFVEVESPIPLTVTRTQAVEDLAMQEGIKLFHSHWFLDFDHIEKSILKEFPELSWVELEPIGNKLYIRVVEKDLAPQGEVNMPVGNILAVKDALVEEVLVAKGTAAVQPGETVVAGQALIYGNDGQNRVTASGIVRSRVWYSAEGSCPLYEEKAVYTGVSQRQIALQKNDVVFILSGPANNPYQYADVVQKVQPLIIWRKIELPVELVITDFYEQKKIGQTFNETEALAEAEARARDQLQMQIPPVCEIIDMKAMDISTDPQRKTIRILLETREDIGTFVPLKEEELLDDRAEVEEMK